MGFPPGPGGPGQGVPSSSPGFGSPPAFISEPRCAGSSQHKAPCSGAPLAALRMCSTVRDEARCRGRQAGCTCCPRCCCQPQALHLVSIAMGQGPQHAFSGVMSVAPGEHVLTGAEASPSPPRLLAGGTLGQAPCCRGPAPMEKFPGSWGSTRSALTWGWGPRSSGVGGSVPAQPFPPPPRAHGLLAPLWPYVPPAGNNGTADCSWHWKQHQGFSRTGLRPQ